MNLIDNSEYYLDYLDESIELKELNKQIKKDRDTITQGFVPINLDENHFVICLRNKLTHEIHSFIHFCIRENFLDIPKYIFVIYSYTFIKQRNKGLNKMLRLVLEDSCKLNNINAIVSLPFKESNSRSIMDKLGYTNEKDDLYIKYIV